MKINFKMMVLAVACAGVFASCNPDEKKVNNSKWVNDNLVGLTYDDENGLDLTYSGETMLGKIAEVKSCDDKNITIAVSGADYEIDALLEEAGDDVIKIATTGLFPGEKVATLSVPYTKDGDEISLNGTVSTDSYTCTVAGVISVEGLSLAVSNVVIAANEPLAGKKFNLVNFNQDEHEDVTLDGTLPIEDADAMLPYHLLWEPADAQITVLGTDLISLLHLALVMLPIINADSENPLTIAQALQEILKSVEFKADGNIVANYSEEPGTEIITSPLNLATYSVLNDHQLALYLNLAAIDNAASEASTKADAGEGEEYDPTPAIMKLLTAVQSLTNAYLPMLGDGIVLNYGTSSKGISSFFLAKEFFKPVQTIAGPLLADEDILNLINYMIESAGEDAGMLALLPMLLPDIANAVNTCTNFELGLNFIAE